MAIVRRPLRHILCSDAAVRRQIESVHVAEGSRVSIVEDDESLREALVGLMRSMGIEAKGFASAEAYLADDRCADHCLITDIQLPGINGIALIEQLRSAGQDMPVIVITARADDGLEAQAQKVAALAVLRKPFDTQQLAAMVMSALHEGRG